MVWRFLPHLRNNTCDVHVRQYTFNGDLLNQCIFNAHRRSCGKVMFLHLSVILFTGGSLSRTPPPHTVEERTVRILLECILVPFSLAICSTFVGKNIWNIERSFWTKIALPFTTIAPRHLKLNICCTSKRHTSLLRNGASLNLRESFPLTIWCSNLF